MNKYLHIICIAIIFLSMLGVYLFMPYTPKFYNNECEATINFKIDDDTRNFEYALFIRMDFTDTGHGYEDMRGVVINNGKRYNVARTINFSFKNNSNSDIYEVTVDNVKKAGQDNLPNYLVAKHLSYTLPKSFIFLRIAEMNQHMVLVSGTQGPVFICSLK
ncbi:hypothetical protein H8I69_24115 [Serratia fonticola]|uniref:FidL-like protein n=1 Tax=Serratia fonticola TaxID=47917 RepID=UPI0015C65C08|nr:FidL-like protein [Serratia fonticola]MBC3382199.1 hypothetical protein [Serratia fonticola]NYA41398.1 hypothetical protein [Serratia fonticola]